MLLRCQQVFSCHIAFGWRAVRNGIFLVESGQSLKEYEGELAKSNMNGKRQSMSTAVHKSECSIGNDSGEPNSPTGGWTMATKKPAKPAAKPKPKGK